jgi:hypothetical protein
VEPVTAWDEPRRLAFDATGQPAPMFELSPCRHVHPPHLHGYLRSNRGEFRLVPLPGGRTRLEGRTWYEFDMFPQSYRTLWSHHPLTTALPSPLAAVYTSLASVKYAWVLFSLCSGAGRPMDKEIYDRVEEIHERIIQLKDSL